ncbi:signal peptidase complex subunit 1 [Nematocida displodere]|uniref:Signal peptidase complex subunit 1 n=1 Tax=Nematocida displodere TaxID=1805483 RepID=A0A177EJ36_9MICR|nr:signal peptidase complex subunit 1 [Nematocida displodere]
MAVSGRNSLLSKLNPQIDYVGQDLSLKILHSIFILGCTLSLGVGIFTSNFVNLVLSLGGTFLLALLVVVPGWPIYRRNPIDFSSKKSK